MHFLLCLYHKCVGCRGGGEGKSKECALLASRQCQRPAGQPWRSPHSPPVEASHRMSWGRAQSPRALRDPRTLRHDPSVGQSRGITASVLSHPSGEWTRSSAASRRTDSAAGGPHAVRQPQGHWAVLRVPRQTRNGAAEPPAEDARTWGTGPALQDPEAGSRPLRAWRLQEFWGHLDPTGRDSVPGAPGPPLRVGSAATGGTRGS